MSKGQSKNGVRLTINNSSPYSTMIITDIDVEPGIDTVILDIGNSLPPYVSGEVQLKKVNKQFTDVKTLIFGGRVTSAEISNYMFPNVTHITVQECSSKRYITKKLVGRNGCLMAVATSAKGNIIEYKLLNTFCKKPGEEIDLKDVSSIEDYAFEGCMSTNVINTDGITTLSRKSFAGSAFHIGGDFTNGVKCFNEVSTPMRCIAPIEVVSKTERSSEKYLQELPVKGFVLEAVPLSSFEHKANEPYADRANKGLFTKPPIHWQMMPKEYFGLCFAFQARA